MKRHPHHAFSKLKASALACLLASASDPAATAQEGFWLTSNDGFWRLGFQPSVELGYWHTDTPPPGLLLFDGTDFFDPQLSLRFNVLAGDQWFAHLHASWDRGFDIGAEEEGDFRIDEAFVRWRPFGNGTLNVQIGKFATCFGNWVPWHDYWDDPFMTPPLPYDGLLAVSDKSARNPSTKTISTRDTGKRAWLPIIWGANYASGASVFGSTEHCDYALEIKNASIDSRPESWSPWEEGFSYPTVTGRIGYRPDAAWAFGVSASQGTYLAREAEPTLLDGESRGDFGYTVLGTDFRWSHHHFLVKGEVIASRAQTTVAGNLDALSYYVEGRWKITTGLYLGARWAQGWNEDFSTTSSNAIRGYDREIWRATAVLGFRLTSRTLAKVEYSYNGGDADANSVAFGFGVKF